MRNAAGEVVLYRALGTELNVQWPNWWWTTLGGFWEAPFADDRELEDGTPLERVPDAGTGLALWG